jgi:hypothetical protein
MWAQQEQRSPARIVSGVGSLKSPGKRGGAIFSSRPRQRTCQYPLTRQGGDALRHHNHKCWNPHKQATPSYIACLPKCKPAFIRNQSNISPRLPPYPSKFAIALHMRYSCGVKSVLGMWLGVVYRCCF